MTDIISPEQVPLKLNKRQPKTIFVNVEIRRRHLRHDRGDADFAVLDKTVYVATVNEGGKCSSKCASRMAAATVSV